MSKRKFIQWRRNKIPFRAYMLNVDWGKTTMTLKGGFYSLVEAHVKDTVEAIEKSSAVVVTSVSIGGGRLVLGYRKTWFRGFKVLHKGVEL